jgi:hypothetical protein
MIFLLLLPFASFFGMLVLLATYGEIIENRSGFEEWLIVMAVLVIVRVFMMGMNRIDRQGRMSGELSDDSRYWSKTTSANDNIAPMALAA